MQIKNHFVLKFTLSVPQLVHLLFIHELFISNVFPINTSCNKYQTDKKIDKARYVVNK